MPATPLRGAFPRDTMTYRLCGYAFHVAFPTLLQAKESFVRQEQATVTATAQLRKREVQTTSRHVVVCGTPQPRVHTHTHVQASLDEMERAFTNLSQRYNDKKAALTQLEVLCDCIFPCTLFDT